MTHSKSYNYFLIVGFWVRYFHSCRISPAITFFSQNFSKMNGRKIMIGKIRFNQYQYSMTTLKLKAATKMFMIK